MRDIFTSIRRTPYQSLASFLILFLTLSMFLFFFNLTSFFHGILSYVETRPQVIVYFNVDTKEDAIFKIKSDLEQSGKVASVSYVSQKEALNIYKELNKDNPLLLEMVSERILPASIEIFAKRPEYFSEIARSLESLESVDEVNYQELVVERLIVLTTILRRVAFALFGLLLVISMTVLLTTTAFKISVKRDEIELLRLLGASKWYIRKPFLAEGLLFGLIAGTVAFGMYYAAFFYFNPFMAPYLAGIPQLAFFDLGYLNLYVYQPSPEYIGLTYAVSVLFGSIIGFTGNYMATSKYIS